MTSSGNRFNGIFVRATLLLAVIVVGLVHSEECGPDYVRPQARNEELASTLLSAVNQVRERMSLGGWSRHLNDSIEFWCIKAGGESFQQVFLGMPYDKVLDLRRPLAFIVHGYVSSIENSPWMEVSGRTWSRASNINVCLVDWRNLALSDYLSAAMIHTRTVGFYIAELIRSLKTPPKDVQIAGHSLGAQIAGFCGMALGGKLGTIYGLDPAGPLFTFPSDVGVGKRLDPSDAQHVQCLHTNSGVSGTARTCGHADFYANMGVKQPGCADNVCHHSRAVHIFEASLKSSNRFMGRLCENDLKSARNQCSKTVDQFGIYGKKITGRFYFRTQNCYPYCLDCVTQEQERASDFSRL